MIRVFSVVSLCLMASGVGAQQAAERHIGVLAPLSGPFEPLGRQIEAGVALAVEGMDGVTVTAVDDACDERQGRDAANQLVGAGVDVVVGGVCWRPANAARDVLAFSGIPFVASGVRYETFTDDADGDVLRLSGRDDGQAQVLASAILDGTLDALVGGPASDRPLALFYTDGNYGRVLAEALQDLLEASDAGLALFEPFAPQDDLDGLAERAQAEASGLVIVLAGQADTALLVDTIATRLPDVPVLAGDSVMSTDFAQLSASGGQGVVFARPTAWRTLASPDELAALEGEDTGSMTGLILPSIAATQVALAWLEGVEAPYATVLGPIIFDENGDADVPDFTLWQWRDGLIWPFQSDQVN